MWGTRLVVDGTCLGLYLCCLFHFLGLSLYQQVILAPQLNPSCEWYWRLGKMVVCSEFVSRYLAHPNISPTNPLPSAPPTHIFPSRLLTHSRSPLSAPHLLLLTKCRTSPPPSPKTWVSFRKWDINCLFLYICHYLQVSLAEGDMKTTRNPGSAMPPLNPVL